MREREKGYVTIETILTGTISIYFVLLIIGLYLHLITYSSFSSDFNAIAREVEMNGGIKEERLNTLKEHLASTYSIVIDADDIEFEMISVQNENYVFDNQEDYEEGYLSRESDDLVDFKMTIHTEPSMLGKLLPLKTDGAFNSYVFGKRLVSEKY